MLEKYLSKTEEIGSCLEWTGCLNTDGYPRAAIRGNCNGKVHREVFSLSNGYYPPVVRHTCDNIRCINPLHLVAGSATDNMIDRVVRGRTFNHVSEVEKQQVINLRSLGLKYKQISNELNMSVRRVEYILTRHGAGRIRKFVES